MQLSGTREDHRRQILQVTTAEIDSRVAFFDDHAASWDRHGPGDTLQRLDELKCRLGLQPGHEVLEVGCGTGQITDWVAKAVYQGRVVAIDFSPAMLAQALTRKVRAEFRLMDICRETATSELFDTVLCLNAFPHFRDKPAALRQIQRHLKPTGQLVVLHLAGSAQLNALHQRLPDPICRDLMPSIQEWPGLLSQASLQITTFDDRADLFLLKARYAA